MSRVLRHDEPLPCWLAKTSGLARPDGPAQLAEMCDWIGARRSLAGFDIVMDGATSAFDAAAAAAVVQPWAAAGATWWMESDWSSFDLETMRRRIEAGPPVVQGSPAISGA